MKKITVYCEVNHITKKLADVSYELISKAYELSIKAFELSQEEYIVEAVALSDYLDDESIKKAYSAGATNFVFVKSDCLTRFCQTVFAQCFIEYYMQANPEIIIFPATSKGRIVAPRITTMLNTGLVADCTGLDFIIKDDKMYFAPTRPTFGSELMATILSKTLPQCATVREKTFKAEFDKNITGKLYEFYPNLYEENRIKLVRSVFNNSDNLIDFKNAKIVLAAGYGLTEGKDKKYFSKLEELAKIIGAQIAATRKVVELGFMDASNQIGQTGSSVEAEVYIAFGVSGAIQHVIGMKNSKIVIAVNVDENAEIFKYADYKIVADAKMIIDELVEKLK